MRIYIAEIAGKDSIAATKMVIQRNRGAVIIPSIVYTRTEYGGFDSYFRSVYFLEKVADQHNVIIKEVQSLSDERLWNILCMRYQYQIFHKFGFFAPCIMCHLFAHVLRIPLYAKHDADAIITGERFLHNTTQKVNQHPLTIECYKEIFSYVGIVLEQPLAMIANTEAVDSEIGDINIIKHANDTKCVLSGNLDGCCVNESELKKFLDNFTKPIGIYVAEQMKDGQKIAYSELSMFVEGLL